MDVVLKKPGLLRWLQVYRLYRSAFPASERKPFSIIVKMYRAGKTDLWCLERDGKLEGFASTINGEERILLDYLAVSPESRGRGLGTAAMKQLLEKYADFGLFVEIESVFEDCPDLKIREKRRDFYRRCGLEPLGVLAEVFGVNMELLGRNCRLDFAGYQAFYRNHYSPWAAEHIRKTKNAPFGDMEAVPNREDP